MAKRTLQPRDAFIVFLFKTLSDMVLLLRYFRVWCVSIHGLKGDGVTLQNLLVDDL